MVASENTASTRKRRHVSKKNKINWRKNVDIQDVEDFLEDKRLEERLGTPFAEKADSELFVVDTAPSVRSTRSKDRVDRGLTAKQRKRLALPEQPKCLQALVNTSQVGDPSGKRNHVRPVTLSKRTEMKKMKKGIYKKKFEMAEKNRALDRKRKRDVKECRTNITQDLWGEEAVTPEAPAPPPEWLSRDTRDCNAARIRPSRPSRRAPHAGAVVPPHPGASYNPNYKDHRELLEEVVAQEQKVIKEEQHLVRVTSAMFRRVSARQKLEENLAELRQGLPDPGEEASADSGEEYRAVNPPVRNRKRDLKKKRHIRLQRQANAAIRQQAKEKKKVADIYKLRFLQKAIVTTEKKQAEQRDARVQRRREHPPAPRIKAVGFREPAPEYPDAADLSGNLRNLVPKGGGLAEHFLSLQRRGVAPVSAMHSRKVAKKKRYTLASHKMPWEVKEGHAKPSKRGQ